jgi:hypothetical protein
METNPYRPPKASLCDLGSEKPKVLLRARWLVLVSLFVCAGALFRIWESAVLFSLAHMLLTLLLVLLWIAAPFRLIHESRSQNFPLVWEVTLLLAFGLAIFSAIYLDDWTFPSIFIAAWFLVNVVLLITILFFERKHQVKIYSSARGYVFVRTDE